MKVSLILGDLDPSNTKWFCLTVVISPKYSWYSSNALAQFIQKSKTIHKLHIPYIFQSRRSPQFYIPTQHRKPWPAVLHHKV